jgi:hypothetical protein
LQPIHWTISEEGFKKRTERLKTDGGTAFRNKQNERAKALYLTAIAAITNSPYLAKKPANYPTMHRDLAILYSNMAAVCAGLGDSAGAIHNALKSVGIDPTFHKVIYPIIRNLHS